MLHALLLTTLLLAQAPDASLPPSADDAKAALEKSPRHGEYIDVKMPGGGVAIRTWISYPERKDKAGVVIVIQEVFGLTDWLRAVADQLAKEGFIAVAPDSSYVHTTASLPSSVPNAIRAPSGDTRGAS